MSGGGDAYISTRGFCGDWKKESSSLEPRGVETTEEALGEEEAGHKNTCNELHRSWLVCNILSHREPIVVGVEKVRRSGPVSTQQARVTSSFPRLPEPFSFIRHGGHHLPTRSPRPRHNCILNFSYDTPHTKRASMFLCRCRQSRRKNWRAFPPPIHSLYSHNTCLLPQFYFAVQSGGSFDVDFEIKDPNDKVVLDGQRERQGDYVLTANTVGEYSFCFENDMSTLTDKLVDIDIMIENEPRLDAPAKAGQIQEQTSALEESIYRLNSQFMSIKRTQK